MPENSKLKNVILLYGDPSFYPEKLIKIKKYFFPNINQVSPNMWKEIDVPKFKKKSESEEKWINFIDAEITCSSWMDDKKIILLKKIIDSSDFLEYLFNVFKNIPTSNYLILCDEDNTLNTGKASFGKLKWIDFKQFCSTNATIVNAGQPISELATSDKIKYIVDEFKKQDKKITHENASLLLEIVGDNRLALNSEINKISVSIDSNNIEQEDVRDLAFPMSKDYPVWAFYSSLNTGSYMKTMEAAQMLLSHGFNYDGVVILCLKQIRWHVIYSHLLLKYGALNKLNSFSASKANKKEIFKQKLLDPRILNAVSKDAEDEFKNENIPSTPNNRDILNFLNNILPKYVVSENTNKKQVILDKSIERYISAFNGLYELRTGSVDSKEALFANTIRKLSIIK